MDTNEIMKKIYKNYEEKNYEKTLKYIDLYLDDEETCIYDDLLDMYINCLINLGLVNEASQNINLMQTLFPSYYNDLTLMTKYIKCYQIDIVKEKVSQKDFSRNYFYQIGRLCYLFGYHQEAEEYLKEALSERENSLLNRQCKEILQKIELYKNNPNIFKEMSYLHFKNMHETLQPGHIIYSKKYKTNRYSNDKATDFCPYLIWKVEKDIVYAFPITYDIKNEDEILIKKEDYPTLNCDSTLKLNSICIEKKDITTVVNKLEKKDYQNAIWSIYNTLAEYPDILDKNNPTGLFIEEMLKQQDIKENDVIMTRSPEGFLSRMFFILKKDYKNQIYKTIELVRTRNGDVPQTDKIINISSTRKPIIWIWKIDEEKKENILRQIPENFKIKNMNGYIVNYDSKKLEIMLTEKDYYLCLDRTDPNSQSLSINLLANNIPLEIIDKVDQEEYQNHLKTLKDYLSPNTHQLNNKKVVFLKEKRN